MRVFKPLRPYGHLPYIFLQKTQRRSLNIPPCRLRETQRVKTLKSGLWEKAIQKNDEERRPRGKAV